MIHSAYLEQNLLTVSFRRSKQQRGARRILIVLWLGSFYHCSVLFVLTSCIGLCWQRRKHYRLHVHPLVDHTFPLRRCCCLHVCIQLHVSLLCIKHTFRIAFCATYAVGWLDILLMGENLTQNMYYRRTHGMHKTSPSYPSCYTTRTVSNLLLLTVLSVNILTGTEYDQLAILNPDLTLNNTLLAEQVNFEPCSYWITMLSVRFVGSSLVCFVPVALSNQQDHVHWRSVFPQSTYINYWR